jgi:hypothetical protein
MEEREMKLEIVNPETIGVLGVATLKQVFKVAAHEYGLDDIDGTVEIKITHPKIESLTISRDGISILAVGGATRNKIFPGNVMRVKISPTPDPEMSMMDQLIHVTAHELVHVAQQMKGRFSASNDGIIWEGKTFTNEDMEDTPHSKLPWEVEAEDEAKRVYPIALASLKAYANSDEGKALYETALKERASRGKSDSPIHKLLSLLGMSKPAEA